MKTLFDLTGKVAAVTGAGGVLCSQMAKALAQAGAKVAVMDLSEEAAKKVADEINEAEDGRQTKDGQRKAGDRRQRTGDKVQKTEERI